MNHQQKRGNSIENYKNSENKLIPYSYKTSRRNRSLKES